MVRGTSDRLGRARCQMALWKAMMVPALPLIVVCPVEKIVLADPCVWSAVDRFLSVQHFFAV